MVWPKRKKNTERTYSRRCRSHCPRVTKMKRSRLRRESKIYLWGVLMYILVLSCLISISRGLLTPLYSQAKLKSFIRVSSILTSGVNKSEIPTIKVREKAESKEVKSQIKWKAANVWVGWWIHLLMRKRTSCSSTLSITQTKSWLNWASSKEI